MFGSIRCLVWVMVSQELFRKFASHQTSWIVLTSANLRCNNKNSKDHPASLMYMPSAEPALPYVWSQTTSMWGNVMSLVPLGLLQTALSKMRCLGAPMGSLVLIVIKTDERYPLTEVTAKVFHKMQGLQMKNTPRFNCNCHKHRSPSGCILIS